VHPAAARDRDRHLEHVGPDGGVREIVVGGTQRREVGKVSVARQLVGVTGSYSVASKWFAEASRFGQRILDARFTGQEPNRRAVRRAYVLVGNAEVFQRD